MTKIYILLMLITLTSCGQKIYNFESKIKPEKIYTFKMNVVSSNQFEYLTELESLKNKKDESKNSTSMTRVVTTEKLTENGKIPAIIKYGEIIGTTNGKENINIISGTIVKGIYTQNKFKVDSVISNKLNLKTKKSIKYALENVKTEIEFPKEPLKIGDSFEHKMPMNIPIEGINPVKIDIIKIFTLKKVNNGIATFSVKENIELNTKIEQENVIANGYGSGIVEFDISENQIIKNNTKFRIELKIKVNNELEIRSISTSNAETSRMIE